jgi:hypothetical protein
MLNAKSMLKFLNLSVISIFMAQAPVFAADGWYNGFNINALYVRNDVYLIDTNSTLNCGMSGRFSIKSDVPLAKQMYTTALAAFLGGKKIDVYVDGAQGCVLNGMVITNIGIHN